jgi:WD40 repeat protein
MLRMVREVEPPRPSTKLGAADALPNIAANRSTEPAKLANALRKELDWVVMKALEKDRNRRYDSANGFATDVQRYLAGEAVQAVPPSAAYRLRKFIRRNRGLVLATALVFLSLIGGVIGTALGLAQARRQEKATRDEADQKEIARQGEAEARVRAEHATAGVRLDLDLAGYRDDPKTSLLRLARTLRGLPDHCREYREFATVAILSGGQEFAPLIPPITHDGRAVDFQLSPDGRTLFTLGPDRTGRLWDALTGHLIGSLRDRNELIAQYGFSPDGRWFFADDQTGAIRVWSTRHGSLRCEIPPRQKPYPLELLWTTPPNIQFSGDRLLILRVVGEPVEDQYRAILRGPVELWDAVSGRRIAELAPADRGGADFFGPGNVRFSPGGEWVFVRHDKTTLDVFSAADGRRLGTLAHPGSDAIEVFAVNPLGTRLLTQYRAEADRTWHLRGWQTARWTADPISPAAGNGFAELIRNVDYLSDDAFVVEGPRTGEVSVMKHGRPAPVAQFTARLHSPVRVADGLAWLGGDVIDIRSGERVVATGDRRFHPELVRFTSDGRFINGWGPDGMYGLIDTRADKAVLPGQVPFGYVHVPEAGFVAVHKRDGAWVHRIALLDVSPEYLELWLQVAVRGELGPGRQFVGWDEVTWERKRRELAARSVPVSGFPFPGRVATDRLHWLRGKYDAPDLKPAERLPLLDELVRRAEEDGDSNAATMWRAERSKYRREAAAPPREKR